MFWKLSGLYSIFPSMNLCRFINLEIIFEEFLQHNFFESFVWGGSEHREGDVLECGRWGFPSWLPAWDHGFYPYFWRHCLLVWRFCLVSFFLMRFPPCTASWSPSQGSPGESHEYIPDWTKLTHLPTSRDVQSLIKSAFLTDGLLADSLEQVSCCMCLSNHKTLISKLEYLSFYTVFLNWLLFL